MIIGIVIAIYLFIGVCVIADENSRSTSRKCLLSTQNPFAYRVLLLFLWPILRYKTRKRNG